MSDASAKSTVNCPCGEVITGTTEDELVENVQAHLKANHPGHDYTRDQILSIAT